MMMVNSLDLEQHVQLCRQSSGSCTWAFQLQLLGEPMSSEQSARRWSYCNLGPLHHQPPHDACHPTHRGRFPPPWSIPLLTGNLMLDKHPAHAGVVARSRSKVHLREPTCVHRQESCWRYCNHHTAWAVSCGVPDPTQHGAWSQI